MTQDVDLMVRDHPSWTRSSSNLLRCLGFDSPGPMNPPRRFSGYRTPGDGDFVRALSSRKSFASIRSRAVKVRVGNRMVWVASLEDVIAAKEAAARPKDKATLAILKETQSVRTALKSNPKKHTRE